MKKKQPMYMFQCIVCKKSFYTEDVTARHCDKLAQWIKGIEGKGVDMNSPMMKIKVSFDIEISKENWDNLLEYGDTVQAVAYALHMPYVNINQLEYEGIEG